MDEQTAVETTAQADTNGKPFYIVGIGASAGGLEAIEKFFDHMPTDSGMAFVIVQHLSPDFKSMMDELLARHTAMPIHRIENEMEICANSIYLIPPKKNLVVSDGKLLLADHESSTTLNLPIDIFFRSLAQDVGEKSIGVILSGTGSDGSRGVREIHEAGGLVIVQDEESAKFDGMPRAAIATGLADFELPPHSMPDTLLNFIRHPFVALHQEAPSPLAEDGGLSEIFALLRAKYGIDFTYYKPSTVQRRIERRITIARVADLSEYLHQLSTSEAELDLLYADLLIGVTEFFRDGPAFELIEKEVVPQVVANVSPDNAIRVWVPGCATGEEAYSLAILLHEEAQKSDKTLDIKVFATDVHQRSLDRASAGIYNEASVANVSADRLARYFIEKDGSYHISQSLRQMVIFANHNIVKDPPFTKIDLVSCRNMLIYLQPLAQRKVLSMFHFALRTGAILFLGPSESVNELGDEFDAIDHRWKIYKKRRDVRLAETSRMPLTPALTIPSVVPRQIGDATGNRPDSILQRVYESVMAKHAPPGLLVNENRELVHVFGDARKYLQVPEGQVTVDVMKMIDGDLRLAVSSSIHRSLKENAPVVYNNIRVQSGDEQQNVKLTIDPINDRRSSTTFLFVCLEPIEEPPLPAPTPRQFDAQVESSERITELERELQYTKEHLQTTIEELETSNEELQSTNEELVAANEELQSTNEELHSVNEELYTVNAEHQRKIEELTQLTADMDNLLRSTEIGTVFVDRDLHIRKFTPAIADTINLLPQDVGRPIEHISHNIDLQEEGLLDITRRVLATGEPVEREVHNRDGRPFLMRVFPYRSEGSALEGVVLSFIDTTKIEQAKQALRDTIDRYQDLVDNLPISATRKDAEGRITFANKSFCIALGKAADEIVGKTDFDLFPQSLAEKYRQDDLRVMETRQILDAREQNPQHGEIREVHVVKAPWVDEAGNAQGVLVVFWDVTERARIEEAAARLAAIVESSDDAILSTTVDGTITSWNASAERLYGYTADEAIGQSVGMLDPKSRPNELADILAMVQKDERLSAFRTVRIRKDGSELPVSLTVSPIKDNAGKIVGASAIARDITQRVQHEEEQRQWQQKLTNTNEELQQFAYVASHDLREPLRTVRSFCELLAENYSGQLDEQADKWIEFMTDGTSRMQALIDDLLQYSRLETKAKPIELTNLNDVVANVVADLQVSIEESNADVQCSDLPTLHVEPTQMRELFQNLISNAIKYRGDDPPKISITVERRPTESRFSVADNGLGIKKEYYDKVFELFKRLHARDQYSGTGIGLAICRKIVHRHGGKIWVESKVGKGATFYFTIPNES